NMLEPETVDSDLLDPSVLTDARLGALAVFQEASRNADGDAKAVLDRVTAILSQEVELDLDIRTALVALFRG
ncbi:MAG: hypothetical protein AAF801_05050, partial [Pseudomonadota bacterium]